MPYKLHVTEYHAPKRYKVTLIMLHGIGSSAKMWEPVARHLPDDIRIIAIDLLGFGASPKPSWKAYSTKTQADSIVTTLFGLKVRGPVVVVGHSLGALVAVEFARRYPIMTKSLVLVSPPFYDTPDAKSGLAYRPDVLLKKIHEVMAGRPGDAERLLRLASKYNLVNRGFEASSVSVSAFLATLEAAIINQTSMRAAAKIKRPIHIISGTLDALVLKRNIDQLAKQNSAISHQRVVGGHEIIGAMQSATVRSLVRATEEAKNRV
jgi:pimeloyl-ACP methyl ester carboxylesterase